ncbi:MAG: hypothetical protein K8T89_23155 [Planctomycetes bacterium]|nr:hypothetical protein [Planctomycetota bacterium]
MAFNPFDTFRKNSKPILAVVTIFIMFIFVLSSGVGQGFDFFDWIARQFGGEDRRGQVLGTIEGKDYYQQSLQEIRLKRAAANSFLFASVDAADRRMLAQVEQDVKQNIVKGEVATLLQSAITAREELFDPKKGGEQLGQFKFFQALNALETKQQELNSKDHPVDFRDVSRFLRVISGDDRRIKRSQTPNMTYFNAIPNTTEEDALQFAMYLTLADKLGIVYTEDDIKKLLSNETDGQLTEEDAATIDRNIRQQQFRGISSEQIFKSIGDEYRVITAMKVLSGSRYDGRPNFPVAMTPYNFYEFYKDRCNEVTFDVIDVPVEPFLSQVKEEPSDQEIRKLYTDNKSFEYDPASPKPGFKEPRKARVEFIAIDASKARYKDAQPFILATSVISGGLQSTLLGAGNIPGVMSVAEPLLAESLAIKQGVGTKVEFAKISRNGKIRSSLWDWNVEGLKASDPKLYEPIPVAAMIGQLAGARNPFMDVSAMVASQRLLADAAKTRQQLRNALDIDLATSLFPSQIPIYLLSLIAPSVSTTPEVDEKALEAEEKATLVNTKQPRHLAKLDLEKLEGRLNEIRENLFKLVERTPGGFKLDSKKIEQANNEARTFVAEWLAGHAGFLKGSNTNPADRFHIGDDLMLAPAFDVIKSMPEYTNIVRERFFSNVQQDLVDATLYQPVVLNDLTIPADTQLDPKMLRNFSQPIYVAWKIEDRKAITHPELKNVPPDLYAEIVKAWKMEKARVLAEQAANALANDLRSLAKKELIDANNPAAFDKGMNDRVDAGKYTLLTNPIKVAVLRKKMPTQQEARRTQLNYEKVTIDNKQIRYPLPNMTDLLLEVRNKPVGEVVVTPDVPKSNFYVAVMTRKDVPSIENFYNFIYRYSNVATDRRSELDTLYGKQASAEAAREFMKDLDDRLKAETKLKITDAMKKEKELTQQFGQ